LLIDHFLAEVQARQKKKVPQPTEKQMQQFMNYDYPGNVRQLKHMVERFVLFGGSTEQLFAEKEQDHDPSSGGGSFDEILATANPLKEVQGQAARSLIVHALKSSDNNFTAAARLLGIGRSSLYRKAKEYGVE